ncbi:MAG: TonB-dependent receptor [Lysobacter sp.]|nr:TonB-dependent receptor [Lysobacter sp.]
MQACAGPHEPIAGLGGADPRRYARRDGIEVGVYWFGNRYFEGDIEASYTRSELTDHDPAGSEIPGSIPLVVSAGLTGKLDNGRLLQGVYGTLRVHHFGKYPLIEDDSVRSGGSTIVNLRVDKDRANVGLHLDVLNLLDSDDHDIDYFYASRRAGEPDEGVEDIHFHPFEPRALRLSLSWKF